MADASAAADQPLDVPPAAPAAWGRFPEELRKGERDEVLQEGRSKRERQMAIRTAGRGQGATEIRGKVDEEQEGRGGKRTVTHRHT